MRDRRREDFRSRPLWGTAIASDDEEAAVAEAIMSSSALHLIGKATNQTEAADEAINIFIYICETGEGDGDGSRKGS